MYLAWITLSPFVLRLDAGEAAAAKVLVASSPSRLMPFVLLRQQLFLSRSTLVDFTSICTLLFIYIFVLLTSYIDFSL